MKKLLRILCLLGFHKKYVTEKGYLRCRRCGQMMGMKKMLEIKNGNKTTYKIKQEFDELEQKDLTTSGRKSIGYCDISSEQWDKIFKGKDNDRNKI